MPMRIKDYPNAPRGTTPGHYATKANPATHAIYCGHCDYECTPPAACCPVCLSWDSIRIPVRRRDPDYYFPNGVSPSGSFHHFGKLPPEIRRTIWRYALPGPRVVYLRRRFLKVKDSNGLASYGYESPTSIPLLYVCRESYDVVCTRYSRAFEGGNGSIPQIWFNFDIDTLYLECGINTDYLQLEMRLDWSSDFQKVKKLATLSYAFEAVGWDTETDDQMEKFDYNCWLDHILCAGSIEQVTLLSRRHPSDYFEDLSIIYREEIVNRSRKYQSSSGSSKTILYLMLFQQPSTLLRLYKDADDIAEFVTGLDHVRLDEGDPKSGEPSYDLPNITCGIVTTTAMRKYLETFDTDFQTRKMKTQRIIDFIDPTASDSWEGLTSIY